MSQKLSKKMSEKKLQEWNKMTQDEKAKWNGFDGFIKSEAKINIKLFTGRKYR